MKTTRHSVRAKLPNAKRRAATRPAVGKHATAKRPTVAGPLERQAKAIFAEARQTLALVERSAPRSVAAAAEAMISCLEEGGTVFFCGNGGSAADAQHLACELAGRFTRERVSLPAVALSANTSSITAIANDYGFDFVFSRQLEGIGTPGDLLVAISTSGGSANVLRAVEAAKRQGMVVIGFTGPKGKRFAAMCDHALITPHATTPRIQEGHIVMGHALCELVERAIFESKGRPQRRRDPRRAPR